MIETVTIERIYKENKTIKRGTPDEQVKPYIALMTKEYPNTWLGLFPHKREYSRCAELAEGQPIRVVISRNGEFYNFRFPTLPEANKERIEALEQQLERQLEQQGASTIATPTTTDLQPNAPEVESKDEIPF